MSYQNNQQVDQFLRSLQGNIREMIRDEINKPSGVTPGVYNGMTVARNGMIRFAEAAAGSLCIFQSKLLFSQTIGATDTLLTWQDPGGQVIGHGVNIYPGNKWIRNTSGGGCSRIRPVDPGYYTIHVHLIFNSPSSTAGATLTYGSAVLQSSPTSPTNKYDVVRVQHSYTVPAIGTGETAPRPTVNYSFAFDDHAGNTSSPRDYVIYASKVSSAFSSVNLRDGWITIIGNGQAS